MMPGTDGYIPKRRKIWKNALHADHTSAFSLFKMEEPYDGKLSRMVLGGRSINKFDVDLSRLKSNHFPLSNFYEALIFLTWCLVTLNFIILFEPFQLFSSYLKLSGWLIPVRNLFSGKKTRLVKSEEEKGHNSYLYKGTKSLESSLPRLYNKSQFFSFFFSNKKEKKIYGGILAPCILFIIAFAQFNLSSEFTPLVPALKSNWLLMHVSIMICSYTTFIGGGLISVILLIQTFFFSSPYKKIFMIFSRKLENQKIILYHLYLDFFKPYRFNELFQSVSRLSKYFKNCIQNSNEVNSKLLSALNSFFERIGNWEKWPFSPNLFLKKDWEGKTFPNERKNSQILTQISPQTSFQTSFQTSPQISTGIELPSRVLEYNKKNTGSRSTFQTDVFSSSSEERKKLQITGQGDKTVQKNSETQMIKNNLKIFQTRENILFSKSFSQFIQGFNGFDKELYVRPNQLKKNGTIDSGLEKKFEPRFYLIAKSFFQFSETFLLDPFLKKNENRLKNFFDGKKSAIVFTHFCGEENLNQQWLFSQTNNTKSSTIQASQQMQNNYFYISLDNLNYRMFGIGFPLFTLGLLSGAVWANSAWGSYWSWDIKEVGSFIHWVRVGK